MKKDRVINYKKQQDKNGISVKKNSRKRDEKPRMSVLLANKGFNLA